MSQEYIEKLETVLNLVHPIFAGAGDAARVTLPPAILGVLDDNVVIEEAEGVPNYAGTFHGHEGFRELVERIGRTWDFTDIEPQPGDERGILDAGDTVIATATFRARFRHNGREICTHVAEFWTFGSHGKAIRIRPYYFDTLYLQQEFAKKS